MSACRSLSQPRAECLPAGGDAAVAVNENGARTTPAVVAFSDAGEVSVGAPAKKQIFSRI